MLILSKRPLTVTFSPFIEDNTDTLKSCMYQKRPAKVRPIKFYWHSIWSLLMTDHGSTNIDILESSSDTNHLHPTTPLLPVLTARSMALELTLGPSGCEQSGHPSTCSCSLWFSARRKSHPCTAHCSVLDKMLGCVPGWLLPVLREKFFISSLYPTA